MGLFSSLFKKEVEQKREEKIMEYEYIITNTEQKELKKIYNTDFSIVDIYLKPYKDDTAIKVLKLNNDNIIGDIPSNKISEVLNLDFRTGQIYVDADIDDNGKQYFKGTVFFKKRIKI